MGEHESDRVEVAVVGAGPAGVAAAHHLRRFGFQVHLFETAPVVGGRTRTVHRDGFVIDEGAAVFTPAYDALLRIVGDAQLSDEVVPARPSIAFSRDGSLHTFDTRRIFRDGLRSGLLSTRSKSMAFRLMLDTVRAGRRLQTEDLTEASSFDHESLADYAGRRLSPELYEYVIDPALRGLTGCSPRETSPLVFFAAALKWLGARWIVFRNGMGQYSEALAKGFSLSLSTEVTGVEIVGDEVAVTWRTASEAERSGRFAGCVLAVPATAVPRLHPRLDPWRAEFLGRFGYTRIATVNAALAKPPDLGHGQSPTAIVYPASDQKGFDGLFFPHVLFPGRVSPGKALVTFYPSQEWSHRLLEEDDHQVVKEVLARGNGLIKGLCDHLEFATVSRWPQYTVRCPPGFTKDLAALRRLAGEHDRLVQLAGDYFGYSNMNSATESGEQAARRLAAALGASPARAREANVSSGED